MTPDEQSAFQRRYYRQSAERCDAMHVQDRDEHGFAIGVMLGIKQ